MATFERLSMFVLLVLANRGILNFTDGLATLKEDSPTVEKELLSLLHRLTDDVNSVQEARNTKYVELESGNGSELAEDRANNCINGQVQILRRPRGTIKSPGYGRGSYPNNADCAWRIQAPANKVIELNFDEINIEDWESCGADSISVYYGGSTNDQPIITFCGRTVWSLRSTGNKLLIYFYSDGSVNNGRFKFSWSFVDKYRPGSTSPRPVTPVTPPPVSSSTVAPGSSTCGQPIFQPNINFNAKIVGGTQARPYSYPWHCSVQTTTANGRSTYQCAGSVISPHFILTAAHCFFGNGQRMPDSGVLVDCGIFNVLTKGGSGRQSSGGTVTVHENYDESSLDYDIAVIRLNNELTYTDYVRPVCLPSRDLPTGTKCVAAGWGNTKGTGSKTRLRQAVVPILRDRVCSIFSNYNPTTMMCAGYRTGEKGTCQGDSGGPLVCPVNGKWYQPGITSFVAEGCTMQGGYARVPGFLRWIQQKTGVGPTTIRMDEVEGDVDKDAENDADDLLTELNTLIDKLDTKGEP